MHRQQLATPPKRDISHGDSKCQQAVLVPSLTYAAYLDQAAGSRLEDGNVMIRSNECSRRALGKWRQRTGRYRWHLEREEGPGVVDHEDEFL